MNHPGGGITRIRRWPWILLLAFAVGAIAAHRSVVTEVEYLRFYTPEGYYRRVEAMIQRRHIVLDTVAGAGATDLAGADPARTLTLSPQASRAERLFWRRSYLAADLRFPERFIIDFDNKTVRGIKQTTHRQKLPFAEDRSWKGMLLFWRDDSRLVLRDLEGNAYLVLPRTGTDSIPLAGGDFLEVTERDVLDLVRGRRESLAPTMRLAVADGGEEIARFRYVGPDLAMEILPGLQPGTEVYLNGDAVSARSSLVNLSPILALEAGDVLLFKKSKDGGRDLYEAFAIEEQRQGVLSAIQPHMSGLTRVFAGDLLPAIARPLARAMTAALSLVRNRPRERVQQADVRLTLRRRLQARLQDRLVRWSRCQDRLGTCAPGWTREACHDRNGQRTACFSRTRGDALDARSAARRRPPFRAAITLMDAVSGEVLAMASYPDEATVALLDRRLSRHASPAVEVRRREIAERATTLTRNHNLEAHQVGSVFKPFLATSVVAHQPKFRTLAIPAHPREEDRVEGDDAILGYQMGRWTQYRHGETRMADFIARSCQRYMEYLGLLALADTGSDGSVEMTRTTIPAEQRAVLGNRRLSRAVSLERHYPRRSSDSSRRILQDLATAPAFAGLEAFFGMEPGRRNPDLDWREQVLSNHDTSPWRNVLAPLVEQLRRPGPGRSSLGGRLEVDVATEFAPVSPTRVFHWLNSFQSMQDYTQFLKGSGRNRWNNILLAQGFSRIVTGWLVEANLGDIEFHGETGRSCGPFEHRDGGRCVCDAPAGTGAACGPVPLPFNRVHHAALLRELETFGGDYRRGYAASFAPILEGLEAVTTRGTAARMLSSHVESARRRFRSRVPTWSLRVYSKTGSTQRPWTMTVWYRGNRKVCTSSSRRACPGALYRADEGVAGENGQWNLQEGNYVITLLATPRGQADRLPAGVTAVIYVSDLGSSHVATRMAAELRLLEDFMVGYLVAKTEGSP